MMIRLIAVTVIFTVFMLLGACVSASKDHSEYKEITVRFLRVEKGHRWEGEKYLSKDWFVYVDDEGQEHWLEQYHNEVYVMQERR